MGSRSLAVTASSHRAAAGLCGAGAAWWHGIAARPAEGQLSPAPFGSSCFCATKALLVNGFGGDGKGIFTPGRVFSLQVMCGNLVVCWVVF